MRLAHRFAAPLGALVVVASFSAVSASGDIGEEYSNLVMARR